MNDILLDQIFDLQINPATGDWLEGESTGQHQALLLMQFKGDLKDKPAACVGAGLYLKDDNEGSFLGEIKQQFEADGMTVTSVTITDAGKLNVNAHY